MNKVGIPVGAIVFICDGRKALFLRNAGDAKLTQLVREKVLLNENPLTHEQGTDRPGRAFKGAGTHRRSGMDSTDWHELSEHEFARRAADALNQLVQGGKVDAVIVAAPPRTLAELRERFSPAVKQRIIAQIDKDLTKHPIEEIEKHLAVTPA
jgi:protein required for attachment to host cells